MLILQGFWHCKNHQHAGTNSAVPPQEGQATSANQVSSADVFQSNAAVGKVAGELSSSRLVKCH